MSKDEKQKFELPEMKSVVSSNVAKVGYDEEKQYLFVEFTNGITYLYHEVPKEEYTEMMSAESIGKFLNVRVKGIYTYEKV